MKQSNYNIMIPYKTAIVIYNTLWDTCLMAQKNSSVVLQLSNRDIDSSYTDTAWYKELIKNKMIISDDTDELSIIRETLYDTNTNKKEFVITINPTLSCNFHCWYCYENHNTKKMDDCDIKNIILLIKNLYSRKELEYILLNFFGGEPLLCFEKVMQPIIEATKTQSSQCNKLYGVAITTNAYLMTKKVIDYLKSRNTVSVQVTIDGNEDRHNKVRHLDDRTKSYKKIISNIKYAVRQGIDIIARLNISQHTNLDVSKLLSDFDDLSLDAKKHLYFCVQKVWQSPSEVYEEVERIISQIRREKYNCQIFNQSYHTITNTCYADKYQHIIVNPSGDIFGCTATDFTEDKKEGTLNNGMINFNKLHSKRLNCSPLDNNACLHCNILPICIAGCKEKQLEASNLQTCPFHLSEKDRINYASRYVMDRFS